MYKDNYEGKFSQKEPREQEEDVFSKPVRAGKRTYFFDVKATRGGDYFLTITESKRKVDANGNFTFDKHKIFLYKEDFEKFSEGLQDVIQYVRDNIKTEIVEQRSESSSSDVKFEEL